MEIAKAIRLFYTGDVKQIYNILQKDNTFSVNIHSVWQLKIFMIMCGWRYFAFKRIQWMMLIENCKDRCSLDSKMKEYLHCYTPKSEIVLYEAVSWVTNKTGAMISVRLMIRRRRWRRWGSCWGVVMETFVIYFSVSVLVGWLDHRSNVVVREVLSEVLHC